MDFETPEALLNEAIKDQFHVCRQTDAGTDEETKTTSNLEKLYKLKIEEERLKREAEEKEAAREQEAFYKAKELEEEHRNNRNNMILRCVELAIGTGGLIAGFTYEVYGSFSSQTLKQLSKDLFKFFRKH